MFSLLRVLIVSVLLAIGSLVQDSSSFIMIHNTNLETEGKKSLLQKNHLSYTLQPHSSSSSSSFSSPSIALNGNGSDDDRDGDEDGDDNNGDLMNQHYYPAYGGEASVELNDEDDDEDDDEISEVVSTTSVNNNIIQDSCGNDYDDDGDERLQKSSRYWRNLFTKFFSN